MNNTKKAFMLAGAIISIVYFVVLIYLGFLFFVSSSMMTLDYVRQVVDASSYDEEMLQAVLSIAKTLLNMMAIYVLVIAIVSLVFSIKVLKQSSARQNKKANIITLLVVSVLSANIITAAFMIVALCLKFEQPQTNNLNPNQNEVVMEKVNE